MTSELDLLMKGMSEERRQSILKRADELEVYFNSNGDIYMKGKVEGQDGKIELPKGYGRTGEGGEL